MNSGWFGWALFFYRTNSPLCLIQILPSPSVTPRTGPTAAQCTRYTMVSPMSLVRPFSVTHTCLWARSMWKMACSRIGLFPASSLPSTGTRRGPSTGSSNLISFTLERSAEREGSWSGPGGCTHRVHNHSNAEPLELHTCSRERYSHGIAVVLRFTPIQQGPAGLHSELPTEMG